MCESGDGMNVKINESIDTSSNESNTEYVTPNSQQGQHPPNADMALE